MATPKTLKMKSIHIRCSECHGIFSSHPIWKYPPSQRVHFGHRPGCSKFAYGPRMLTEIVHNDTIHNCNATIILMNYYSSAGERHHFGYHRKAPASLETIRKFLRAGILDTTPFDSNDQYQITEKGRALVRMILATPFPKEVRTEISYVDPRTGKEIKDE